MFGKGSKLYSIFRFKCPHCHEGRFFESNNPYDLAKLGTVLKACPVCHKPYSREIGFYYGAMYVSYALAVASFVTVVVAILVLLPEASTELLIGAVLVTLVVLGPVLYAFSKIIWANLFFKYEPFGGVDPHKVAPGAEADAR